MFIVDVIYPILVILIWKTLYKKNQFGDFFVTTTGGSIVFFLNQFRYYLSNIGDSYLENIIQKINLETFCNYNWWLQNYVTRF